MQKTITLTTKEYSKLKRQAEIDAEFLGELVGGLADIKAGRIKQVR